MLFTYHFSGYSIFIIKNNLTSTHIYMRCDDDVFHNSFNIMHIINEEILDSLLRRATDFIYYLRLN